MGRSVAANCKISGDGLSIAVAGEPATFIVTAYDQYGNEYPFGGSQVQATISGPASVTPTVTDLGNGQYLVSYMLTKSGAYNITLSFDGQPAGASPFYPLAVNPNVAFGATTTPVDSVPSSALASEKKTFAIQAKDKYGNPVQVGGATVTATLSPVDSRDSTSSADELTGVYTLSYTTFKAQRYDLAVTLNGQGISGSPFPINTDPAEINPSLSVISNLAQTFVAGAEDFFTILTQDSYGNPLRRGGAIVQVSTEPVDAAFVFKVEDLGTGQYSVSLYFELSGKFEVTISVNGVPLSAGSHPVVVQPAEVSIPNCVASGEDLTSGFSGVRSSFLITAKDRFNNNYGQPLPVKFEVFLLGKVNLSASAVNADDGTATVTYTPLVAGAYQTYITSLGTPIFNSPSLTSIQTSSPSPPNSFVLANSLRLSNPQVLKITWLQVQIRDQYDNEIAIGGHNMKATVLPTADKGEVIPANLTDNHNGTYSVVFLPTESQNGQYVLSITLDSKDIKGSPLTIDVKRKEPFYYYYLPICLSIILFFSKALDKTNAVAIGVSIPIVVICVVAFFGLIIYRRRKARRDPASLGFSQVPQQDPQDESL